MSPGTPGGNERASWGPAERLVRPIKPTLTIEVKAPA
jgi:hypothetical protein